MAKGKYALGEQYFCERCGNQIKVLDAGGGNLICCVKAMQRAKKDVADSSPVAAPKSVAEPQPQPGPTALATPEPKKKRDPVDPATIQPVYFYDVSEFGAKEAVRKPMFNGGDQNIDLICLRYSQSLPSQEYETDQAILLIEGRGTITLGSRQEDITTGASLVIPAGVTYGIKNTSPDDMFVVAISAS